MAHGSVDLGAFSLFSILSSDAQTQLPLFSICTLVIFFDDRVYTRSLAIVDHQRPIQIIIILRNVRVYTSSLAIVYHQRPIQIAIVLCDDHVYTRSLVIADLTRILVHGSGYHCLCLHARSVLMG